VRTGVSRDYEQPGPRLADDAVEPVAGRDELVNLGAIPGTLV